MKMVVDRQHATYHNKH